MAASSPRDAFILGYVRTPFARRNGSLAAWRPDDLAAFAIDALLERYGVPGEAVEDVLVGNATQVGPQGGNVARMAVLASKRLPQATPATTVHRVCGSGQQAVSFAATAVRAGDGDLFVAGGVEHMTSVPIGSDYADPNAALVERGLLVPQGEGAERIADRWGIAREELDAFSLESHRRAVAAQDAGHLKNQIAPVPLAAGGWLGEDEHPRRDTSMEKLARLKPVYRPDGRITAGSASGVNDGAAMLLVGSAEAASRHGLAPLARVVATDVVGSDPTLVLTGPIDSTRRLLRKTGLAAGDVDAYEVNEAFASVVLAWSRELGVPLDRVNPWGGAIAIGHPLGASGGRLLMNAVEQLRHTGGSRAVVTMCIGAGQGISTLVERV